MSLPRGDVRSIGPLVLRCHDVKDVYNATDYDWTIRPGLYGQAWTDATDADGIPDFGPVANKWGPIGGWVYAPGGGTGRTIGQWQQTFAAIATGAKTVRPVSKGGGPGWVKSSGANDNLGDLTVETPDGSDLTVDDAGIVVAGTALDSYEFMFFKGSSGGGAGGGIKKAEVVFATAGGSYCQCLGPVPIDGPFTILGTECEVTDDLHITGTPGGGSYSGIARGWKVGYCSSALNPGDAAAGSFSAPIYGIARSSGQDAYGTGHPTADGYFQDGWSDGPGGGNVGTTARGLLAVQYPQQQETYQSGFDPAPDYGPAPFTNLAIFFEDIYDATHPGWGGQATSWDSGEITVRVYYFQAPLTVGG